MKLIDHESRITKACDAISEMRLHDDPTPRSTIVHHPPHYNSHPSGIECITITEHMNFNLGNAVKYLWRVGLKSEDPIVDLEKARWYLDREIARLKQIMTEATR